MSWITACFDALLICSLVEELFWEGDSTLMVILTLIAGSLVLPKLFSSISSERYSINFPFILIVIALLFLQISVGIDEALYKRLMKSEHGLSIGALEMLSFGALIWIFIQSIKKESYFDSGKHIVALGSLFAVLVPFISGSLKGRDLGFSLHFIPDSPGAVWALVSISLLCLRLILIGPKPSLSLTSNAFLSKGVHIACGVLIFTLNLAAVHSFYLVRSKPLQVSPEDRHVVSSNFLLPLLVDEDPIFFHHYGIDFVRLRDVIRETLEKGVYERGGSTIAMQLAKIKYLSYEKTMGRKIRQALLGIIIDFTYSKEDILRAYIESVPYGPGINGLKEASKHFFGSEPSKLSELEGMKLALAIFDPNFFNPASKREPPRIVVRTALTSNRIRRYSKTLLSDLENYFGNDRDQTS